MKDFFAEKRKEWAKEEADWNKLFADYKAKNPEKAQLWKDFLDKKLPDNLESLLPKFGPEKPIATRNAGGDILKVLFGAVPNLIGGSADLAPSTKTWIKEFGSFEKGNYGGRNLHFGIREHGMGTIVAGLAYYGGLIPFGSTFFVFTDYMRPPIRLAALSGLQTIYVFTHDSIFVGEDGPTHEPVEHLAALRAIPRVHRHPPRRRQRDQLRLALRAAAQARDQPAHPHAPEPARLRPHQDARPASGVLKGGYTLWESKAGATPDIILIGTGSEVGAGLRRGPEARRGGQVGARRFAAVLGALRGAAAGLPRQRAAPGGTNAASRVEAGVRLGWQKYIGDGGKFVGVDKFGASAPYERLQKEYGLTTDHVLEVAKSLL